MPEVGLILTDLSLKPIAWNREAAAILSYPDRSDITQQIISRVPKGLLEQIRRHKSTDVLSLVTTFGSGKNAEYICRIYFMDSHNECPPEPIIAFLLERSYPDNHETIDEVAAYFNLTGRERQVLNHISLGLTDKEAAQKLSISPNTVKCFVRLIMIKMGVTTRTAIMAKILAHNNRNGTDVTAARTGTNL